MRSELILLVTYKKNKESSPTSKILRIRRGHVNHTALEKYVKYLNLLKFIQESLDEPDAVILNISVLNQVEEFLLKL